MTVALSDNVFFSQGTFLTQRQTKINVYRASPKLTWALNASHKTHACSDIDCLTLGISFWLLAFYRLFTHLPPAVSLQAKVVTGYAGFG